MAMAKIDHICPPGALRRAHAAAYVGCSVVHFDKLVSADIMPQPRIIGSVRVWLRCELDEALLSAPIEDVQPDPNLCDRLLSP